MRIILQGIIKNIIHLGQTNLFLKQLLRMFVNSEIQINLMVLIDIQVRS